MRAWQSARARLHQPGRILLLLLCLLCASVSLWFETTPQLPAGGVDFRALALAHLRADAVLTQGGDERGESFRCRSAVRQPLHVVKGDDVDVGVPTAEQPG